jgi:hypothetical protein
MAKRLQIILQNDEYREIERLARDQQISIAQWIRQTLALALRRESIGDVSKKLDTVRAAVKHEFPAANIDQMLDEIAQGYRTR